MILEYTDLRDKKHQVRAKITTDHSASSYGQSVIVLEDGGALDLTSWVVLGYKVVMATDKEILAIRSLLNLVGEEPTE